MVLRELFLKLGLDVDEASFAKGQLAAGLIEAGLKKVVEVGKELIESFAEQAKEAIEYGNKIKKTSESIGIATDALQELQYAGQLADLGAEEFSQSIGLLSRKMLEAKNGGKEVAKAFKGIAFQEGGKLKATDEVLASIADKFATMPDGAEKTAMAMELFGRAGKQMIPLLNKGSGELEELRKEARELGLVMGGDAVDASEELNDNLARLKAITQGLWRSAIAPLLPVLNKLVKQFLDWRKANAEFIKQKLDKYIGYVAKALDVLGSAFAFVTDNAMAFKVIIGAAGLLMALEALRALSLRTALTTAAAWALAALPFLAIGAAIAALLLVFDDIRVYMRHDGGKSVFGAFMSALDEWMKPRKEDPWFVTALKDTVRWAMKAVELLKQASDLISVVNPFTETKQGDVKGAMNKHFGAVGQAGPQQAPTPGLPMSTSLFGPRPEYRPLPGGSASLGSNVAINAPANFTFVQRPGQQNSDFISQIKTQVATFWNAQVEAAAAGVKR